MAFYTQNIKDWEKIAAAIKNADTVFISSHINPDGDAIGSEMALACTMRNMNKKFRVINQTETPENYKFLDPDNLIESPSRKRIIGKAPQNNDVVIIVDLNTYDRLGEIGNFLLSGRALKIVIDHHVCQEVNADIAVINSSAESTGSLIYDLILSEFEPFLDVAVAQAALTAIVTDSGYFGYSNTTSLTHRIAASIYEKGAYLNEIKKKMETGQPLSRQILLGYTLIGLKVSSCGRIAYSCITRKMLEKSGSLREYTEGIIDQIRIIKDIKIAMLFIEESDDLFKVSFRSAAELPVNVIAASLGGGGHPRAAGANMQGNINEIVDRALDVVIDYLDKKEKICI